MLGSISPIIPDQTLQLKLPRFQVDNVFVCGLLCLLLNQNKNKNQAPVIAWLGRQLKWIGLEVIVVMQLWLPSSSFLVQQIDEGGRSEASNNTSLSLESAEDITLVSIQIDLNGMKAIRTMMVHGGGDRGGIISGYDQGLWPLDLGNALHYIESSYLPRMGNVRNFIYDRREIIF